MPHDLAAKLDQMKAKYDDDTSLSPSYLVAVSEIEKFLRRKQREANKNGSSGD